MRITAAVMEHADGKLSRRSIELQDAELEGPREDEILVKVTSCGVCGTDRGCIHAEVPYPTPGVLGHEAAGVVEDVGRAVDTLKVGDKVVLGFPFCGRCRSCLRGEPRYCVNGVGLMFGGYRLDGSSPMRRPNGEALAGRFFQQSSWATHTIAQARQAAKVPDDVYADLMGPLGCSISTGAGVIFNELQPEAGTSIAIFGAGSVGLAAVMAARLSGATTIIVVEKVKARLALARELGATHAIETGKDVVAELKELTGGELNYAVEATDSANQVAEAVAALGHLGICAMVGGAGLASVTLKHGDVLQWGKTLTGVMGGGGTTPESLVALMRLHAQGRFPLEKLVRRYAFADVNQAIDDSDAGDAIKPILMM